MMEPRWHRDPETRSHSPGAIEPTLVLKDGPLFFVQSSDGQPASSEGGLFFKDMRLMKPLCWTLGGHPVSVLSTHLYAAHRGEVDWTNSPLTWDGTTLLPLTLHGRMTFVLAHQRLFIRIRLKNFAPMAVAVPFVLDLHSTFDDIFQVRSVVPRDHSRAPIIPDMGTREVRFSHVGQHGRTRTFSVAVEPDPTAIDVPASERAAMTFKPSLSPGASAIFSFEVAPTDEESRRPSAAALSRRVFRAALHQSRQAMSWVHAVTQIDTDNTDYNRVLEQNSHDLRALITAYPEGRIVEAGIPWYVAPFGRDAAITGLEALLLTPGLAQDSLAYLAHWQGSRLDPSRDEEPGKILHELRQGELAGSRQIPHTPYFGSIDSTLWWIITLYETWQWTQNHHWLVRLAKPLERAVGWILEYSDPDVDGLLEYQRQAEHGLANQGWKDSVDSILDTAGHVPAGPIALVEVQGLAFAALNKAAAMLAMLGKGSLAEQARRRADTIQAAFSAQFLPLAAEPPVYALDGQKQPVRALTSNHGQLLFTGILPLDEAEWLGRRLLRPDMLSGYGIRTLSSQSPFYNPMHYHNGSVWPHDNAIIAWGFRRIQAWHALQVVADQVYQAARHFPAGRLPELYCGFSRRGAAGPVPYPVACYPQAWAAAAPFFLLRQLLGLEIVGPRQIILNRPLLPRWLNRITIQNLEVAGGTAAFRLTRDAVAGGVTCTDLGGDVAVQTMASA
ncbi:glycogen debranching N-terminal domain-containing protein [Sulfobacillus harzensis]|uniref:Amylo-alpha-1,6-glucosidase n=1 Tax=Sulfobacillus harzensis TaxID=2729629 RepID=A0A7Y0L404_9FIRM|nr:glycogen debranching N-terminal domain-containing protein [Sulfobacillus harzensis]NMP22883.1 amylo-alpha-1,6-glucosidase [Sulfobacillus harzensis]